MPHCDAAVQQNVSIVRIRIIARIKRKDYIDSVAKGELLNGLSDKNIKFLFCLPFRQRRHRINFAQVDNSSISRRCGMSSRRVD